MRPVVIEPQQPIRPERRSFSEIERDEIVRQVIEEAARRLERLNGNSVYRQAWRKASSTLRAMKP